MPKKKADPRAAKLMVNIFDGTRKPVADTLKVLIRIIDGNQNEWHGNYRKGPNHLFQDLPVFNNFGDNYTVVVWAKSYDQAGFTPIKIGSGVCQHVDLMILPQGGSYHFNDATWPALKARHTALYNLLRAGTQSEKSAKERYDSLREAQSPVIAAFLNITTAMASICLAKGGPLDYFRELIWEGMQQDRFFAYADARLLEQMDRAAAEGKWTPETGSAVFHPGATRSYKQIQFGEANIQLTFHEKDKKRIDGVDCVKIEPDMDYHKDPVAHALLEVLPNALTGQKTDPRQIYVLRWIAGRHAGMPEFDPPYTIA